MLLLKTIGIFTIIILLRHKIVSATDDNRYCHLESRCVVDDVITSPLHIGCSKSFAYSPSLYKLMKLKHQDREFIANEFNQFRSDIAMGAYSKIFKYPLTAMNQLEWSHELEYLVSLMISKVPNTNFYCMSTEISDRPSQLYVLIDRPQPFNLHKIFQLALNEIKQKALGSFRDANIGDTVNWSQIYDKDTSGLGCAIGEFNSMNVNNKLLIRCSFYGSKHVKTNFSTEYVSTMCSAKTKDSESFPGLCVKGKFELLKGDRGDIGSDGIKGRDGQKGPKGPSGIPGSPGQSGVDGLRGELGDPGQIGNVGLINNPGEQGVEGEKGECIKGSPGLSGPPGKSGLPGKIGAKGNQGIKGEQGESISLGSLKGEPGESITGQKGIKGERGDIGNKGLQGEIGSKGIKGDEATLKYEVEVPITCDSSEKGEQGSPGTKGAIGPPGTVEYETSIIIRNVATQRPTDW